MENNTRILVVDDDVTISTILKQALQKVGYEVSCSCSAEDALECHRNSPFDLIVSDICMEGMDGLALLAEVKTVTPTTEVIIMTLYDSVDSAIAAVERGAFYYLVKPIVSIPLIQSIVKRALDSAERAKAELLLLENLKDQRDELLQSMLEQVPGGAIILDFDSRLVTTNAIGRNYLEAGEFFSRFDGVIRPSKRSDWKTLVHALEELQKKPQLTEIGITLGSRSNYDGALSVLVRRHNTGPGETPRKDAVALYFGSKPPEKLVSTDSLKTLFGLSKAEVRLAMGLVQGIPLEDIADNHNVSKNTVRVQLQSLYRKTGTSRQHELVTRLLSSVAAVPTGSVGLSLNG